MLQNFCATEVVLQFFLQQRLCRGFFCNKGIVADFFQTELSMNDNISDVAESFLQQRGCCKKKTITGEGVAAPNFMEDINGVMPSSGAPLQPTALQWPMIMVAARDGMASYDTSCSAKQPLHEHVASSP